MLVGVVGCGGVGSSGLLGPDASGGADSGRKLGTKSPREGGDERASGEAASPDAAEASVVDAGADVPPMAMCGCHTPLSGGECEWYGNMSTAGDGCAPYGMIPGPCPTAELIGCCAKGPPCSGFMCRGVVCEYVGLGPPSIVGEKFCDDSAGNSWSSTLPSAPATCPGS